MLQHVPAKHNAALNMALVAEESGVPRPEKSYPSFRLSRDLPCAGQAGPLAGLAPESDDGEPLPCRQSPPIVALGKNGSERARIPVSLK